ncbi:phosphohistidine phosphatase SixA [Leptothermofonsia sp. ETS-13]|uniref:phosphohistidine phosphatase SixA n=1 Tax=Leptothermofonsia sp. ETS-13 TaxID=3035696 RepID=UPI003BA1A09A
MATLDLYIIRHGLAGERGTYANDDERPLTSEGKKKTRQIARRLAELDVQFDLILTSPLVRAKQTAEILLEAGLAQSLEEAGYLAPGGDIDAWIDWLQTWRQSGKSNLALVGHEPDLSEWAETLVWGKPKGAFILKKAGVIGLTLPEAGSPIANSELFWLSPPRFLLGK